MNKYLLLLICVVSFFISSSYAQNVGVDVASPVEKLDVLGAIHIGNTSNTNAGTIRWNSPSFQGYDGTQWVNFGGGTLTGTGTATRIAFWTGTSSLSSNANLYWDNTNSRLGIGTSSPAYKLDVAGSDYLSLQLIAPTSPLLKFSGSYNSGNGAEMWQDNLGNVQINLNSLINALYLKSTGDVGIGNTFPSTPAARLDVNNGTSTVPIFLARDNGTEVMRVADGGNVGIGSATPGAKLDVAGNTKTTNFQMTTSPTADYIMRSDASGNGSWVDPNTLVTNAWKLTGNASTVDGTNFIGTTDNVPFNFKVNNQVAGRIASTGETFLGYQAGSGNTSTSSVGYGYLALSSTNTGNDNTAIGREALRLNTTGRQNSAVGKDALRANIDGIFNNAVGYQALLSNTSGNDNTAMGVNALRLNTTSSHNSAFGKDALPVSTGGDNVGMGYQALVANTTGSFNTAIGTQAGVTNVTGSNNTFVGNDANASANNLTNATAIGANAVVGADNSLVLGNNANVGIGSSSPGAKLDVAGQVKITGGTPALNQVLTSDATGLATWEPAQGDNLGNHIATQNIQLNSNWLSNDGGSEGIRVDNNGNVGVGQTPGSAYLDITGTNAGTTSLQLRSGNSNVGTTSNQVTFGYNGTENYRHAIKTRHNSIGVSDNAIDFYTWKQGTDATTTVGTQHVMTMSAGNGGSVGIGTITPAAQLHTTGSVRLAGLTGDVQTSAVMSDGSGNLSTRALNAVAFTGDLASGDADYIQNQNVGANFATGQNASFDIQSNAEIGGTLKVGGNVGIGTTSPAEVLDIYGNAGINNGGIAVFHTSTSNNVRGYIQASENTGGGAGLIIATSGGETTAFKDGGIAGDLNMVITGVGNVGINSASPSAKLDVAGTMKYVDGNQGSGKVLTSDASGNASWNTLIPAGMIIPFAGATTPAGYLECNGQAVSRTTYSDLFTAIGTIYGNGNGSTTFNLPDYRGYFLRGWNHGASNDPDAVSRTNSGNGTTGDNVGTKQADDFKSHTHTFPRTNGAGGSTTAVLWDNIYSNVSSQTWNNTGGNETRPKNINVMYCIKY